MTPHDSAAAAGTETPLLFACAGATLVGILSQPAQPTERGVLIVVGGPQYRAGSHRQFVLLARALAQAGCAVLRFDYRGMGDSEGARRDFCDIGADIGAALDALRRAQPGVRRIALWGLCDAASAALLYCGQPGAQQAAVDRLVLLNPWVRSPTSLARTHVRHYYGQRLLQRDFWRKLLRGQVAGAAVTGLLRNVAAFARRRPAARTDADPETPFQARMAAAWAGFSGDILLILSGNDLTAREFSDHARTDPAWLPALRHAGLARHELAGADHTFSNPADALQVQRWTCDWLAERERAQPQPYPGSATEVSR